MSSKLKIIFDDDLTIQWFECSGQGIGCFKCTSVNGDNPACEDPFHNNVSGIKGSVREKWKRV